MDDAAGDNRIVQYHPHNSALDPEFAEDLVSLIDTLADSTSYRRPREKDTVDDFHEVRP